MPRDGGGPNLQPDRPVASADDKTAEHWHRWVAERAEAFLLYARQQARCEEDARDLVQEAMVEAWQRSAGRTPDSALVMATIRRRAIDLGRSMESRKRREKATGTPVEPWFEPDVGAADDRALLAAALTELAPHLRETVTLKIWGGLSFPEISEITGVPVPTATSRFRYAIEALRKRVGPQLA